MFRPPCRSCGRRRRLTARDWVGPPSVVFAQCGPRSGVWQCARRAPSRRTATYSKARVFEHDAERLRFAEANLATSRAGFRECSSSEPAVSSGIFLSPVEKSEGQEAQEEAADMGFPGDGGVRKHARIGPKTRHGVGDEPAEREGDHGAVSQRFDEAAAPPRRHGRADRRQSAPPRPCRLKRMRRRRSAAPRRPDERARCISAPASAPKAKRAGSAGHRSGAPPACRGRKGRPRSGRDEATLMQEGIGQEAPRARAAFGEKIARELILRDRVLHRALAGRARRSLRELKARSRIVRAPE